MFLVVLITVGLYIVASAWMWNSLGEIENIKKVEILFAGIFIITLITFILYSFSKNGINYENTLIERDMRNVIVVIFGGVNSVAFLPYLCKIIRKKQNGDIEIEQALKNIIIVMIVFTVCIFFECGYMADIQKGIITYLKK